MFLSDKIRCCLPFHNYRLPEVPPDTAQDNPLLAYDSYPNFNRISPDKAVTAAAKLAIDYDVKLGSHLLDIKGLFMSDTAV